MPIEPSLPATPSYNGSYYNSLYFAVLELDFDLKDNSLGLFNDALVIPLTEDYNPAKYNAPSTGLLMFNNSLMPGVNNPNCVSVSTLVKMSVHWDVMTTVPLLRAMGVLKVMLRMTARTQHHAILLQYYL